MVLTHQVGYSLQRNVFHVADLTGMATAAHYAAMLDAFAYWWQFPDYGNAAPAEFVGSGSSLVRSVLTFVLDLLPLPKVLSLERDLLVDGQASSPPVPANATPAITWLTVQRRHWGRGRTYLCGFADEFRAGTDPSTVDVNAATLIEGAYRSLILTLHDATSPAGLFQLAVYHRRARIPDGGGRVWWDPIRDVRFLDRTMDSQRGRLRGHRR